jgi:flagellar motor switch/type III secretory pathway protein FliN
MGAGVQLAEEKPSIAPVQARKNRVEDFGWLPCQLSLEIPVVKFTVGDLLRLGKESIVETGCASTDDIPLRANGLFVAWSEFEVIGNRLALRITELA